MAHAVDDVTKGKASVYTVEQIDDMLTTKLVNITLPAFTCYRIATGYYYSSGTFTLTKAQFNAAFSDLDLLQALSAMITIPISGQDFDEVPLNIFSHWNYDRTIINITYNVFFDFAGTGSPVAFQNLPISIIALCRKVYA